MRKLQTTGRHFMDKHVVQLLEQINNHNLFTKMYLIQY